MHLVVRLVLPALLLAVLAACGDNGSGNVYPRPPAKISNQAAYVFYLHGRGAGEDAAQALAAKGFEVIAPRRTAETDPDFHAIAVKEWLRELLARGARMDHIALVGTGEGGRLAMMVSGLTQVPASALVVLAACPKTGAPERQAYERVLRLHAATIKGRFLSVVAGNDTETGTCAEAFGKANGANPWEIALPGIPKDAPFTTSDEAWVTETVSWILER